MTSQKQQVVDVLEAIDTGDRKATSVINPHKYIQHNLGAADGLVGFEALVQAVPKGSGRVRTVRVFQDGDYVFAHTEYNLFGPMVGFDIFRFEDGRIVEHWDNLQAKPSKANPSGRSMIDGPVKATELERTAANRALAKSFVEDILVNGRIDQLSIYFEGDDYVQHNPLIADQRSGLREALEGMAKAGIAMKYHRIHKVLGEGNFVLVVSEGELAGKPTSFYDLFRLQNGKVAEHWDTVETIPPRSDWKNANGKF